MNPDAKLKKVIKELRRLRSMAEFIVEITSCLEEELSAVQGTAPPLKKAKSKIGRSELAVTRRNARIKR